jgi:hypothetical protein
MNPNPVEIQPYLRPIQIQRLYGIHAATIRLWFSQKKITGAKLGKIILINHADFLDKIRRIEAGEEAKNVF